MEECGYDAPPPFKKAKNSAHSMNVFYRLGASPMVIIQSVSGCLLNSYTRHIPLIAGNVCFSIHHSTFLFAAKQEVWHELLGGPCEPAAQDAGGLCFPLVVCNRYVGCHDLCLGDPNTEHVTRVSRACPARVSVGWFAFAQTGRRKRFEVGLFGRCSSLERKCGEM